MPGVDGDSKLPWSRETATEDQYLISKYPYVMHSETDAILNKTCESLNGRVVYSVYFPIGDR